MSEYWSGEDKETTSMKSNIDLTKFCRNEISQEDKLFF